MKPWTLVLLLAIGTVAVYLVEQQALPRWANTCASAGMDLHLPDRESDYRCIPKPAKG